MSNSSEITKIHLHAHEKVVLLSLSYSKLVLLSLTLAQFGVALVKNGVVLV